MVPQGGGAGPRQRPVPTRWPPRHAASGRYALGVMYERGEGIEVDFAQSHVYYKMAADRGHAAAQNNLGALYYLGQGVAQDKAMAAAWFEKAAREGYAQSMKNLGQMRRGDLGADLDRLRIPSFLGAFPPQSRLCDSISARFYDPNWPSNRGMPRATVFRWTPRSRTTGTRRPAWARST